MSQCVPVYPSRYIHPGVPVCPCVSQYVPVYPSMSLCIPVCPDMSHLHAVVISRRPAGKRRFCRQRAAIVAARPWPVQPTILSGRHLAAIKFRLLMRWRRPRRICLRNPRRATIGARARCDWSWRVRIGARASIGSRARRLERVK